MKTILLQLLESKPQDLTLELLTELKRAFSRTHKLPDMPSNIQLLQAYRTLLAQKKIKRNQQLEQLLKKRAIRSSS